MEALRAGQEEYTEKWVGLKYWSLFCSHCAGLWAASETKRSTFDMMLVLPESCTIGDSMDSYLFPLGLPGGPPIFLHAAIFPGKSPRQPCTDDLLAPRASTVLLPTVPRTMQQTAWRDASAYDSSGPSLPHVHHPL